MRQSQVEMDATVEKNGTELRNRQSRIPRVLSKSYMGLFNSTTRGLFNASEEVPVLGVPVYYLIIEPSHREVTCSLVDFQPAEKIVPEIMVFFSCRTLTFVSNPEIL